MLEGVVIRNNIKFEIVVCKLFQFGNVSNLSFGKGLNRVISTVPTFPSAIQHEYAHNTLCLISN